MRINDDPAERKDERLKNLFLGSLPVGMPIGGNGVRFAPAPKDATAKTVLSPGYRWSWQQHSPALLAVALAIARIDRSRCVLGPFRAFTKFRTVFKVGQPSSAGVSVCGSNARVKV